MKTITNISVIDNKVLVSYINEVNIQLIQEVKAEELSSYFSFKEELQLLIDKIPDVVESPIFIKYQEDIFTITGNKKEPVLMKYEYLEQSQKDIVDAMKFKVYEVLGEYFVWLQAKIGSGKVTVNSIEYDYNVFKSEAFENAIKLANELLNRN